MRNDKGFCCALSHAKNFIPCHALLTLGLCDRKGRCFFMIDAKLFEKSPISSAGEIDSFIEKRENTRLPTTAIKQ